MVETNTEDLVLQFRACLEKNPQALKLPSDKLDLFSFYSEITALKDEVRIESRLIKQVFVDFQETAGRIEQGNARLAALVQEGGANQDSGDSFLLSVLEGLLDLHDRVKASVQTLPETHRPRPLFWSRFCRNKDREIIQSLRTGQQMILDRLIGLLLACDVSPIETIGQRFDPHSMRAVETDSLPEHADGVVTSEVRTGFSRQGTVLRLADVRVNRIS